MHENHKYNQTDHPLQKSPDSY